jgi:hypothetical protein
MTNINTGIRILQGYFKAEAFENDKCVYAHEDHNKVTLGAGRLITKLLGGYTQSWVPSTSNIGITKFALFSIDSTIGTCESQMLQGSFGAAYSALDPILLSEINTTSFPCLKSTDVLQATTIPVNDCASLTTPTEDDQLVMSSDVSANSIGVCVNIGPGHVATGMTKFYAMAALIGSSPDPLDTNEYCVCLEQFPVMTKTSATIFRFLWSLYI